VLPTVLIVLNFTLSSSLFPSKAE